MVSTKVISACIVVLSICMVNTVYSMPSFTKRFDAMGGLDFIQVCLDNCAQCKRMFGELFQGQACAESCIKFSGKTVPDCEDIGSIAQFLNTVP